MVTERVTVKFEPGGYEAQVAPGTTVLEAARAAGAPLDGPCGGSGRCGSCRVRVEGAVSPMTGEEAELLGGVSVAAGRRLACRTRILGDASVDLGPAAPGSVRVLTDDSAPSVSATRPPALDGSPMTLDAAVDVGTTTLALALIDRTGDVVARAGALNPQVAYGADVMLRVSAAIGGGAEELADAVSGAIDSLVGSALPHGARIDRLVAVGNTAMTALLLGRDVSPLAAAPYAGPPVAPARIDAAEAGMPGLAGTRLEVPPGASAFIGSDIVAGAVAAGLAGRSRPTVLIDLGTNGEIVLAAGGSLVATSTAAGPAFEGASIECGMRAEPGAIERAELGSVGSLTLGVVGGGAPRGVCGSGLLDLIAALRDAGAIDATGRIAEPGTGALGGRIAERADQRVLTLDDAGAVVLAQHDVRAVQLAVAAVATGLGLLLEDAGIAAGDIDEVIVAGGFGHHVSASSLARVGIIPGQLADRVSFAGNTALTGAVMLARDPALAGEFERVAGSVRTADLAAHPAFEDRFLAALTFPA